MFKRFPAEIKSDGELNHINIKLSDMQTFPVQTLGILNVIFDNFLSNNALEEEMILRFGERDLTF